MGRRARRGSVALATALAALLSFAFLLTAGRAEAETFINSGDGQSYDVTIKRTANGIPNINADDFAGIGFGFGYATAQDNICTLADTYITVRAERSRYFGPNVGYEQKGNGYNVSSNLNSDFFYQRINDRRIVENLINQPPPAGPVEEINQGVKGYVDGYNRYLSDVGGSDGIDDQRCRGEDWVKPISEIDAYRRFYQLALLASQTLAIDGIGSAQPPAAGPSARSAPPSMDPQATADALKKSFQLPIGSNAIGLGREATDNGKGMVLGNPHFPWTGSERLWESHLTIPGQLNVAGGALLGVPLVLIGHTDNLAWTHTVSTARRFTLFEETLNPADPTQYQYDGGWRPMRRDTMTVKSLEGGNLVDRTRTLYSTHHGSILTTFSGVPFPWSQGTAFTMGDANATNFRYLNHFFFTNQAQSVAEYDTIEHTYLGIPWVTSTAADSTGQAYFADVGAVPNVSDAKAAACNTSLGEATFASLRIPVLNGSTSECEWDNDPGAVAPGIFNYEHQPKLFRNDYVENSNDSYWISNPEEPLSGYARIIGDTNTQRALRTRIGNKMIQEHFPANQLGNATTPFDRQALQDLVFSDRQYLGELWRGQLVQMCENAPGGFLVGRAGPVNVSGACPVLRNWDLKENLSSRGAVLFRRFAARALSVDGQVGFPGLEYPADPAAAYTVPFNPTDPINTPSGLNVGNAAIQAALADAVSDFTAAGTPLNRSIGEHQRSHGIPIHGGPGTLGDFNAINISSSAATQNSIRHGSSFMMVTQFTDSCPDSRMLVTYSQSENPDSPFYTDQTQLYSDKQWVNPPFCPAEVTAAPALGEVTLSDCAPEGCGPVIDTDGDGVPDGSDGCPAVAGPASNNGCPVADADTDGDGVPDGSDSCPAVAGPASNNGCPLLPPPAEGCSGAITGTRSDDTLVGTAANERIFGLAGDDLLKGRGGDDCIYGQKGSDTLKGGYGDDFLFGGGLRDLLVGGPGSDRILGGYGADKINARDGISDGVNCGRGTDMAIVDEMDAVSNCERVLRPRLTNG